MFKNLLFVLMVLAFSPFCHAGGYTSPPDFADSQRTITLDVFNSTGGFLATGTQTAYARVPYNMTLNSWVATADASGSVKLDVYKDTTANFPPTNADTIVSASSPTITSAQFATGSTAAWGTTALNQGDYIAVSVVSITGIKRLFLTLIGTLN